MTVAVAARSASAPTPVRGTQSFVGVMAEVWKRPSLTLLEVAWRWTFWSLFFAFAYVRWWPALQPSVLAIQVNGWVGAGSVLSPFATSTLAIKHLLAKAALPLCGASTVWILISALGRSAVLKRLDPKSKTAFPRMLLLGVVRVMSLVGILAFWAWSGLNLARQMILIPQSQYRDPALVPFAAAVICGTLVLFVGWMAASYVFQLASVLATHNDTQPAAGRQRPLRNRLLRSRLVEINLVIGIVKIALLVLALVFSACPLPFSSVETQTFLTYWWIGVGVWYAVASDFIHVVRAAAFLRMWQVYENPVLSMTQSAKDAS